MPEHTRAEREVLPIPDRPYDGPVYEDAKDPQRDVPADRAAAAAGRSAERPDRPARRRRLRRFERLRRAVSTRRPRSGWPANGLKFNRFHTTALCSPTRAALLSGRNHHTRGHGRDHGDRDLRAGLQLDPPEHVRAAGRDAEAERLRDGAVRQVPRGAGLGDEPARPVRLLAERRRRLRVLLRLHRRRDEPVLPGASTRGRPRSSRTRRPRRATTSPRT